MEARVLATGVELDLESGAELTGPRGAAELLARRRAKALDEIRVQAEGFVEVEHRGRVDRWVGVLLRALPGRPQRRAP